MTTPDPASYSELAQQTKNLATYKVWLAHAEKCRAKEEDNILMESRRIEQAEARIRELLTELGLA